VKGNKSSSNHQIGQDPRGPIMRARYRRANREGKFQFHVNFCGYGMMNLEMSGKVGRRIGCGSRGELVREMLLQLHEREMQPAVLIRSAHNAEETNAAVLQTNNIKQKNKLHGLSPRANYTDRATAACRRSDCQLLRIKSATWSA
jgi:hypothetical protein